MKKFTGFEVSDTEVKSGRESPEAVSIGSLKELLAALNVEIVNDQFIVKKESQKWKL